MSFIDQEFPRKYMYGSSIGLSFSTEIVPLKNNREDRNENNEMLRAEADLSYRHITQASRDWIANFHMLARGALRSFRVYDVSDHDCKVGQGFIIANPDTGDLETWKRYTLPGGETVDRRIAKPIESLFKLYDGGGAEIASTLDPDAGTVTTGATWSGEFHIPMRFVNDKLLWTVVNRNRREGRIYTGNIKLIEDFSDLLP